MGLRTRLTESLSIRYPVMNAPMGGAAGGALAAAVTNAGGLGLIGGGISSREYLEREFEAAGNARVGCGFITWGLAGKQENLEVALDHAPAAIMLSYGDPSPYISRIQAAGITVICQVQTVAMARQALNLGANIIVAQGSEAGGHGGSRGTAALVPAVADIAAAINPEAIVLGAGGIADGRGLAAMLMLGAEGVLIGTRFLTSTESLAPDTVKARVVAATGDDTVRGRIFDIARGTAWPPEFSLRTLQNEFTRRWHGRDHELANNDTARERCKAAFKARDYRALPVLSGEAVDLIHTHEPVAVIVENVTTEAKRALTRRFDAA